MKRAKGSENPTIAKLFIQLGWVDELGSVVLNVNRLIKEYTDRGTVQFIEGATFKTIIPVSSSTTKTVGAAIGVAVGAAVGAAVEDVFVGASKGIKEKLAQLLTTIYDNEGKRSPGLIQLTKISERSMDRYLQQLRNAGLIEFKGDAAHTGGYFLTEKMKVKLRSAAMNDQEEVEL